MFSYTSGWRLVLNDTLARLFRSRWPIKICAFAARILSEQDKKAFSAMDATDGNTEPATVGSPNNNIETLSEMGRILTGVVSTAST